MTEWTTIVIMIMTWRRPHPSMPVRYGCGTSRIHRKAGLGLDQENGKVQTQGETSRRRPEGEHDRREATCHLSQRHARAAREGPGLKRASSPTSFQVT